MSSIKLMRIPPEISELDDDPTEIELSEAIYRFSSGKASGNENIPT